MRRSSSTLSSPVPSKTGACLAPRPRSNYGCGPCDPQLICLARSSAPRVETMCVCYSGHFLAIIWTHVCISLITVIALKENHTSNLSAHMSCLRNHTPSQSPHRTVQTSLDTSKMQPLRYGHYQWDDATLSLHVRFEAAKRSV